MTNEASDLAGVAIIGALETVYDALTPGAIERADLDGMAFVVQDAIKHLRSRPADPDNAALEMVASQAYIAGATAVHEYWTNNPGEAPQGDPEFGEAAGDYARATLKGGKS